MSITLDSPSIVNSNGGLALSSLTKACTVASATHRILIVGMAWKGASAAPTSSALTYSGNAMTLVPGSRVVSGFNVVELWYQVDPVVGTANIVANWTGTAEATLGAECLQSSSAALTYHNVTTNTGSGTAISTNLTSASGEYVIDQAMAVSNSTFVATAPSTKRWDEATAVPNTGHMKGAGSDQAGAATTTMAWTLGTSGSWLQSIVGVMESGGSPSPTGGSFFQSF